MPQKKNPVELYRRLDQKKEYNPMSETITHFIRSAWRRMQSRSITNSYYLVTFENLTQSLHKDLRNLFLNDLILMTFVKMI